MLHSSITFLNNNFSNFVINIYPQDDAQLRLIVFVIDIVNEYSQDNDAIIYVQVSVIGIVLLDV